ncbi:MAG: hypothetical protein ACRD0O_00115 [Acidimicrobiia bacterium]
MRISLAAAPAYVGPQTWDDTGWHCCRACNGEWIGEMTCFVDPAHAGDAGRLDAWCRHGLRLVPWPGLPLCARCRSHRASDFTDEFLDAFALAADRALQVAGISI